MSEDRKLILKMLQENRISVEEAEQLLSATDKKGPSVSGMKDELFNKTGPKMEQFMGSISSMIESVSQQVGPGLEKRFEGWFQQKQGKEGSEKADMGFKTGTAASAGQSTEHKTTITVTPETKKLRCFHNIGPLSIEGNEIQAVLEKHYGDNDDRSQFETLRLTSRQDGEVLLLEIEGADKIKSDAQRWVHLKLQVPAKLDMELGTDKQDVLVQKLSHPEGKLHLESSSGDLELQQLALKHIVLQTTSGNVAADQASESLEIRTQSGDVKLNGSVFDGEIHTQSGSIQLEASVQHQLKAESRSADITLQLQASKGRIDLQSQSGDIELSGTLQGETVLNSSSGDLQCDLTIFESASVSLTTYSGDVDLILRPESECKVEAEALSGDVECRVDLQGSEKSEHKLTGSLGNGQGMLRAQTKSGDILIS